MNMIQMWLFMTHRSEPLRQTSLLMILAGSIGQGKMLVSGLRSYAAESSGLWAGKVAHLQGLIEQGHSLSQSLAMVADLLPAQTISAIRAGEMTGTVPEVLIDEARRISQNAENSRGTGITLESMGLMLMALGTVMICIVTFLMRSIVPKLKEIFIGFAIQLPPSTQRVFWISDWLSSYGFLFFIPVTGTIVFVFWWWYSSSVRKLTHGYSRFAESWPRFWVPGLLRQLSLSAATGQPLGPAIEMTLNDMPPGRASRCVREVRYRLETGEDPIVALTSVGLLRSREAAFLQSSLKTRHLDWGLRHLANSIELRRQRWLSGLPSLLAPVVILLIGAVVLFIVASLFMPLIGLVLDLSGETPS